MTSAIEEAARNRKVNIYLSLLEKSCERVPYTPYRFLKRRPISTPWTSRTTIISLWIMIFSGKPLEPPFSAYALSLIYHALWYFRTYLLCFFEVPRRRKVFQSAELGPQRKYIIVDYSESLWRTIKVLKSLLL